MACYPDNRTHAVFDRCKTPHALIGIHTLTLLNVNNMAFVHIEIHTHYNSVTNPNYCEYRHHTFIFFHFIWLV